MKRTLVAIGLCALLALTTACGGSSKKDTTATGSAEKPSETTTTAADAASTTTASIQSTTTTTGGPTTTASTAAPGATDTAFAAQADALCATFNDQMGSVPQPPDTSPASLGPYLDRLLALFDQQLAQLKALSPPASVSAPWAKILQTLEAEEAQIQAIVPRLEAGDTAAMADLQAMSSDDVNAQFDALGMTTCGSKSGA